MFSFINAHKTKIVGGLLVAAGAFQAQSSVIQSLMPPKDYAYFTIGIGVLVALLGFMNSSKS